LPEPGARRRFLGASAGAALGVWGGLGPLPALAQFRVEVTGVGATQVPLAVAALRGEDKIGVPIAAIVRADLQRSGLFKLLAAPEGLDETGRPPLEAVRSLGADALLAGSATKLADGRLDLRYKLWDTVRGTESLSQSQAVVAGDLRLAAHRIADAVHEKLTGEPGVFATRIAFVLVVGKRFTLQVTDADGEGAQVALVSAEPIISPAWSPNGRELAYVSFETQKAVVWVQDVQTGQRRILANFRGSNSAPAWSPDGRELAVTLSQGGPAQLHVLPREGGTPRRLVTSNALDTEPVWAPDGKSLYFVSDRGGGPQIYRVAAGGGTVERISFTGNYNISPAVSPDGRLLAYIARQGAAFKLMVQELDGGTPRALTDTADDESPSFAPKGRLLVYATRQQGRDVLMTTTLDGKIKSRLLSSGGDVREPAWGPFQR
jgi:TolB protein